VSRDFYPIYVDFFPVSVYNVLSKKRENEMFSRQQIRTEIKLVRNRKSRELNGKVADAWIKMMREQIASDDSYLVSGFIGFDKLGEEEIILDFHFAGKLSDPLLENKLMK
jgi:ssDNA-binding replication factor A large subunit